jgi:hypothetical protein
VCSSDLCSLLSVLVTDFEVMGVNPTTNSNALEFPAGPD